MKEVIVVALSSQYSELLAAALRYRSTIMKSELLAAALRYRPTSKSTNYLHFITL
jgi:hypothetical protein